MNGWRLLPLWVLCFVLIACGKPDQDPELFLPRVKSPQGADLEELRARYCQGARVSFGSDFLTHENFRSIFNCANYDGSLEELKPLFTRPEFPDFIRNLNTILGSDQTRELRDTLRTWLEEGPEGSSRIDRLLPILAKIIKNPSFQEALPVFSNILAAGDGIWPELLPALADVIYQPRFPDNFEDILVLFEEMGDGKKSEVERKDYAKAVKDWARFLKREVEGKTVARMALELADDIRDVKPGKGTLPEYLDQMNVKGVFLSLFLENGEVRGEKVNPKLNADPDEEEIRDGLNLTPAERQERARRKLFTRGKNGEAAPIVQLASLVNEFHKPHDNFLPSIARWFSANGTKISDGLFEYVAKALVRTNLTRISAEAFLTEFAQKDGGRLTRQVTSDEFVAFLAAAFASEDYSRWLETSLHAANREQFGEKNARLLSRSTLRADVMELYKRPEVSEFGRTIVPNGRRLALTSAIKRFSNLHRGEKLKLEFRGTTDSLEPHLINLWMTASNDALGESVVVNFVIQLAQTFFSEFANDFGSKKVTLAQWYFSSTYGNPDSTETMAAYAFKDLNLLASYHENKDWLKTTFANELFPGEAGANDRRAFRLLVDQVPNIWLYVKSGMARSGNDLTRALSSKDRGFLIQNYVAILSSAYESGWIERGVRLLEEYFKEFPAGVQALEEEVDDIAEKRRRARGVDALKRILGSLFEPEVEGDYESSTLRRLLKPLSALVSRERRGDTEKFLVTAANELLDTPDSKINDFFDDLASESGKDGEAVVNRRETVRAVADLLKRENFPTVLRQINRFFQADAVRPALRFLATRIEDGSLNKVLLFLRRVLGFQG